MASRIVSGAFRILSSHVLRGWLLLLVAGSAFFPATVSAAGEPPEKAMKYYEVLARRPSPGYLFDRFYNAWLDEATVEELEAFLVERAAEGKSGDGLMLAFFYAKQGDDQRTLEQFRKTLSQDPGNAAAWYEKAIVEARVLNFDTALADLARAAESRPEEKLAVQVAKLRGKLLVRNRQRGEAIKVWNALLAEHFDDEELAEDVIELQIEEGLFDEAAQLSRALVERTKDPYKRTLRELRLGDVLYGGGKRSEAIATYRATLERVGAESWLEREILAQIERVFRREDDLAGLQKEYESLVVEHPRRVGIHRAHARVLSEAGDAKGAIDKFREILKLTPGDRANQEAFIELHVQAQDLGGAIKHLQALIEQHPQDGELLVQFSQLQAKADQKPAAAQTIDKFLAGSDKSEYAYLRAARLLEQLELNDAAKEKYAALVAAFPDSVSAKEAQAVFLYKTGEKEPALEIWRSLAAEADAQQLVRLARALSSRNEHELAYEILEKRHAEFGNSWLFLGQLITEALANKKYAEAIPWALARVEASETSGDLNDAIAQAATAIERAEEVPEILRQLQSAEHKSLRRSCLLAELLELSADSLQADEALVPWIEKGEPLAVMQQVRLATRRYDWAAASEAMRRLVDLPGERKSQNVRRLIEFYERDFRLGEALNWVAEWKKLSPGSTTPWLTQSRLQLLSGKEEEAIETLRQAAKEFDGNEEVRMQLAQLYGNMGKYADAQRIYWLQYEEAESLGDKLRNVEQLARLAEQQGSTEALVENFEERRRSNRQSVEPLLALATIHRVTNNYEGRRQALAEASKLKPEDLELLHEIARIEEQEGQWERAKATLEGALALDKTNRTRQRLARLVIQYGDPDEGFAMLYQLAGGEASDPRDIETVADSMIGAGDWQRAKELLATHVQQHPDDYRLRYLLAVACEEEDEQSAAIEEFLTALQADKEIQGLRTPHQVGAYPNDYLSQLGEILPKESIDIVQFQQARWTAYSYRQQRGLFYGTASRGGPATRVQLPSTLEQVRQYALMHLLSIAHTQEEEEQQQLLSRLHGAGVANAALLLAVTPIDIQMQVSTSELLEKFPDNEAVHAVLLLGLSSNREEIPATFYQQAFKQFEARRPQLALLAAVQGASRFEETHELLKPATELLDRLQKPNSLLVMQLCQHLGRLHMGEGAAELPATARKLITAKLIDWYPQVRNQQPYGQYIFMYVSRALRTSGDAQSFVRLLEDEVARHRSGANPSQQQQQVYYGGQQEQFLSLPKFPPQTLADFPTSVVGLLSRNNQYDPFGQTNAPAWENAELAALVPQVNDPILRVLLAAYAEAENVVDETLAKLLGDGSPMLDAFLLGATRATSQEKYDEAMQLFEKARYLPMNRNVRRTVDESLVAIALEEPEMLKESDDLRQAARNAALRLRHGTMQPEQRTRLITALEELGLEKEAELLEKKSAVATTAAVAPRAVFSSVQTSSQDQIRRLIDQGKRDVAARTLANEALSVIRQGAANPGNWSYTRHQVRQVRERIASYRLMDDVLAALDPKDSDNHRKWADFGMLNEALEKYDEAQAAYERALELRPKEDSYRSRLVFLVSRKEPAAAVALCEGFGRNGVVQVIGEVLGRMREHDEAVDARLQLGEFAKTLFVHQSKIENSDLSWGPVICEAIGARMYSRNGSIPPLYMPASASDIYGNGVSKETLQRRQELHDAFCREMLAHADTAEEAFTLLLASLEAQGKSTAELADVARETLLKTERNNRAGNAYSQYGVYYSNNGLVVPRRRAAEFLIQHCFKNSDWGVLDDEVLPHAKRIGRRDIVDEITQYRMLFTCEPSEFVAHSERYVREAARRTPQHVRYQGREPEQLVCEAWAARELDIDLQALVLKFAAQSKQSGMTHQAPNYLLRYAVALAERGEEERASDFYESLAQIYLGPREKRAEFISRNYNRQMITSNSPNAHIHAFGAILQAGLQEQRLLEPTLRFVREGDVESIVQNLEHHLRNGLKKAISEREPQDVVAYLEGMGLLGGVQEFARQGATSAGGNETVVSLAGYALRELGEKQKEVKELLEAREPQTFGSRMLLATWSNDSASRQAVVERASQELQSLRALDAKDAQLVAEPLGKFARGEYQSVQKAPAAVRGVLEWIEDQNDRRGVELADRILAAKRYEDLKVPGYDAAEWLATILTTMIEHDPDKAADMYFHVAKLHDEAQNRNATSFHYSNSAVSEMFSRMMHRFPQDEISRTLLLLAVLEHEKAADASFTFQQLDQTTVPLRLKYTNLFKEFRQQKKSMAEFLAQYQAWLTEVLRQRFSPILLVSFQYSLNLNAPNAAECAEMERWLNERIGADDAELSRYMLTALQRFSAKRDREAAEKGQPPARERVARADYHEELERLLADGELPMPVRLILAEMLFGEEHERLPISTALAIAQLGHAACTQKAPFQSGHHQLFARNALGLVGQPEHRETLTAYVKAWHERFGRRGTTSTHPRPPDTVTDPVVSVRLLALYLRLAPEEWLNQLVRQHESLLNRRRETVPLLVGADQPELAERLLRTNMPQVSEAITPPLVEYNAELEEKSRAFFERVAEPQTRYFAQVLIASLPDPKPLPEGVRPRKERLRLVAEGFAAVPWKVDDLRHKSLLVLATSEPALSLVTEQLKSAADAVDLPSLSNRGGDNYYYELVDLVARRIEIGLAEGDAAPLARFIDQTVTNNAENDWPLRYAFQRKSQHLAQQLGKNLGALTKEQIHKLRPAIRAAATPHPNYGINNPGDWTALSLVLHVRTGEVEAFQKWHESLEDNVRQRVKQSGLPQNVWNWLAASFGKTDESNLDARVAAVSGLLRLAESHGWIVFSDDLRIRFNGPNQQLADRFAFRKLFSAEELAEVGPRLVELAPVGGATARSLAAFHAEEKRWGAASTYWAKVLASLPVEQAKQRCRAQIYWADGLWNAGKQEEARDLAEKIELKGMSPEIVKAHAELQKKLAATPAGNEQEPATETEPVAAKTAA